MTLRYFNIYYTFLFSVYFLVFIRLKLISKLLKTNIQKASKRLYFHSNEDI